MTEPRLAAWLAEVAEDFVDHIAQRSSEPFDLTPPSLHYFDALVGNSQYDEVFERGILPAMAVYLGEVVVRAGGGEWVEVAGDDAAFVITRTGCGVEPDGGGARAGTRAGRSVAR